MDFVNSRLFGQVDLPPAVLLAKLADSFSELNADIRVHSPRIDLVDALSDGSGFCFPSAHSGLGRLELQRYDGLHILRVVPCHSFLPESCSTVCEWEAVKLFVREFVPGQAYTTRSW